MMWIDLEGLITSPDVESKLQMVSEEADFVIGARIKKTNYLCSMIYNGRIKPEYWEMYSEGGSIDLFTTVFDRRDELYEDILLDPKDFYILSTINKERNELPQDQEKLYIEAFDELEWYIDHNSVYLSTDEKYKNPFHAEIIEQEQIPVSSFLMKKANIKAYVGQRYLHEATNNPYDATNELFNFYKRWDCEESPKIQEWYYKNNSEYRMQFEEISVKTVVHYEYYYDVYFSNMPSHKVKELVEQNLGSSNEHQYYDDHEAVYVHFKEREYYNDWGSSNIGQEYTYEHTPPQQQSGPMIIEPTDEFIDRLNEEAYARWTYEKEKKSFENDHPSDNYDDFQYFERIRDGEE